MLKKRVISGIIMIPLPMIAIFLGNPFLAVMGAVIGAVMAWEWQNMIENKCDVYAVSVASVASITSILAFNYSLEAVIITILASIFYAFSSCQEHKKLKVWGFLYISLPLVALIWLREESGYAFIFWILGVVLGTDIGGYIFGCSIGGPLLLPSISPKKTWAGLVGGMIMASFAGLIYAQLMSENLVLFAVCSAVLAIVSQVGDFFESGIKRKLNIKDSSNLIPGHGGVFARIDGLLLVAPLVALFYLIKGFY